MPLEIAPHRIPTQSATAPAVRTLVNMLPEEQRNTPEVQDLAAYGCTSVMRLVEINAEPLQGETDSREYDFTKATIEARWQADSKIRAA